jgi:two-component system, NarL family, captular synthesis response regulator RcsB
LNVNYVYYCDDALERLQKAKEDGLSYDLLITDLYFEADHRVQKIKDGTELIVAARHLQPDLKILVFSAENKATVIEMLYERHEIDGFVRKARNDAKELKTAITSIFQHQRYLPRHLLQLVKQKHAHEFTDYDIIVISLLAGGTRQKDIPAFLQQNDIRPSGLSSVEKRLNHIKEVLEFSKNEQLVAYCKDMGII